MTIFAALSVALTLSTVVVSEERSVGALPRFRAGQNRAAQPESKPPVAAEKVSSGSAEVVQFAPPKTPSEVNTEEVIRRGDRVILAGRGPMATADAFFADATSPPADDSHKWFVSLIVDDSLESRALLFDVVHEPTLSAWMDLNDGKSSWSHVKVYQSNDETTRARWAKIKISQYPVMILQPPTKLSNERDPRSWEWGPPETVVYQWSGYPAKEAGRAKTRSDQLRSALELYIKTITAKRSATPSAQRANTPVVGPGDDERTAERVGAGQVGGPPPFTIPGGASIPSSNPFATPDPISPVAPQATGAIGQLLTLALNAMGSGGFWVFVLVGLKIFELYARATPGVTDDMIAAFIRSIVDGVQKTPTTPTPTTPTITGR